MTNAEIIEKAAQELMEAGIIKGSGEFLPAIIVNEDGTETETTIELPEAIHTFAAWKELGYSVKKGEHAKASFPIWKYKAGKEAVEATDTTEAQEATPSHMFMTKAFFFTFDQVQPINA